MYPDLFTFGPFEIGPMKIGPFTIHSFGLMLGIGLFVASIVLAKELRRKHLDQNMASTITLLAAAFGIAGSKILFLIESWDDFIRDPIGMTFSAGGLTWYGGFFLATLAVWIYVRRRKIPFLKICDAIAPGLMLGYGVARIGCHLAGDGDYGMPTDLPWGAVYSKGTYPPHLAFRDFPDIVRRYGVDGVVPDTIRVHPAPIYEFILGTLLFLVLWKLRTRYSKDGVLFMWYLILAGGARFLVEFIRLNPRLLFGLSEAQLFSVVIIAVGIFGMRRLLEKGEAGTVQ
ncbi:MAG TPA: prolipoprotein diacylglyceryl transferase [Bacteroidota bacterium]|nr:prolipoprotein diacylglyceryl transferase [Bacteroidota bacterium]